VGIWSGKEHGVGVNDRVYFIICIASNPSQEQVSSHCIFLIGEQVGIVGTVALNSVTMYLHCTVQFGI